MHESEHFERGIRVAMKLSKLVTHVLNQLRSTQKKTLT